LGRKPDIATPATITLIQFSPSSAHGAAMMRVPDARRLFRIVDLYGKMPRRACGRHVPRRLAAISLLPTQRSLLRRAGSAVISPCNKAIIRE
jgi:hypothetical protein